MTKRSFLYILRRSQNKGEKEKMRHMLMFLVVVLASCTTEPVPTGPTQEIPITNPVDGGASASVKAVVTEFCSVKILWNFTDREIVFTNKADQTAWVTVNRGSDKTQIVDAVIYSQSESAKKAVFAEGEEVEVIVEFLSPNLSLDQWPECDRKTYVLGK